MQTKFIYFGEERTVDDIRPFSEELFNMLEVIAKHSKNQVIFDKQECCFRLEKNYLGDNHMSYASLPHRYVDIKTYYETFSKIKEEVLDVLFKHNLFNAYLNGAVKFMEILNKRKPNEPDANWSSLTQDIVEKSKMAENKVKAENGSQRIIEIIEKQAAEIVNANKEETKISAEDFEIFLELKNGTLKIGVNFFDKAVQDELIVNLLHEKLKAILKLIEKLDYIEVYKLKNSNQNKPNKIKIN